MTSPAPPLPAPQADIESAFYWQGLKQGELRLQRCNHCRRVRFPAMPGCPYCGKTGQQVILASGTGQLYSWVVVHHPFNPSLKDEVPYAVGVIELAEGCRLAARLSEHSGLKPGLAFEVYYVAHDDWTEARFRRSGG